jgi:hypothetical protein
VALTEWSPEVADVGALLRARTKDSMGNELGTFTDDTRPTGTQVEVLIGQATDDVATEVANEIPEPLWDMASSVVVVGTALLIELTYFPEAVATGRSPYTEMSKLYADRLGRLRTAVGASGEESPSDANLKPSGTFAPTRPPIVSPEVGPWGPEGFGPPGSCLGSLSAGWIPW